VVLVLVNDELDEYFVVYMFNFVHMSVAVTLGFSRDVCINLMCLPFVSNLGCIWYGSRFMEKSLGNHLAHLLKCFKFVNSCVAPDLINNNW
jgi:hypothetical protein